MKENSSQQCSLGCKESDYTNLIINKTYLRGITSFWCTGIYLLHFLQAEIHQKRFRIPRLVLQFLDWHSGKYLTLLWAPGEQPLSVLQPQPCPSFWMLSAVPCISKDCARWLFFFFFHRNTTPGLLNFLRNHCGEPLIKPLHKMSRLLPSLRSVSITPVAKSFADFNFSAIPKFNKRDKPKNTCRISVTSFSPIFLFFKYKIMECTPLQNICLKKQRIRI